MIALLIYIPTNLRIAHEIFDFLNIFFTLIIENECFLHSMKDAF